MYEARQNKEKASRQIDGGGMVRQIKKTSSKNLTRNKLIETLQYHEIINDTVQRKVGFEFQTVGGEWNVKRISSTGNKLKSPSHGEEIMNIRGLSIQSDFSDLEFVTSAFDEKDNNEKQLLINQISQAAEHLNFWTKKSAYFLINPERPTEVKELPTEVKYCSELPKEQRFKNWWIINGKGEKTAHPQATIGVELKNIDILISNLINKVTDISVERGNNRGKKKYLIQSPMGIKNIPFVEVRNSIKTAWNKVNSTQNLSPKAKGFVHIVMQYVRMTTLFLSKQDPQNKLLNNAKNAMPFMSRTSLDALYGLLNENEKGEVINFFKEQQEYKNDKCYLAYENSKYNKNSLTFKKWVDTIINNKDLLSEMDYSSVSELPENLSEELELKYGIKKGTDIGKSRQGTILELRSLTRNVKPDKWAYIATLVLNILSSLPVPSDLQS